MPIITKLANLSFTSIANNIALIKMKKKAKITKLKCPNKECNYEIVKNEDV